MRQINNLTEILQKHKKWWNNEEGGERADLQRADLRGADLRGADLQGAYLRGAYLRGADLQGAYLRGADLQGAYLRGADLQGADLQRAYLQGAYLQGAENFDKQKYLPDLSILLNQSPNTKLYAFKFLQPNLTSPYQYFQYELNKEYTFDDCDTDDNEQCGKGGNVATLSWCLQNMNENSVLMKVSFKVKDIGCIPFSTDGKFRVKRFFTECLVDKDGKEL